MNQFEDKIYKFYKNNKRYIYSEDASVRLLEVDAIKNLEHSGYIQVKMNTIGYAIAEII